MQDILKLSPGSGLAKSPRTLVAVGSQWLSSLPDDFSGALPQVELKAYDSAAPLPRELLREFGLLVIEVDAENDATLERLAAIKESCPNLEIIAAVQNADVRVIRTLLHHDVSNVIELPLNLDELSAEIYNVEVKLAATGSVSLAPTACILGTLGRSGTTALLTHLASELVEESDRPIRCCLIDLDLQSGQLATQVGIETARSVMDLLEAEDRLDQDMLNNVATKVHEGIYLISSPSEILPIEQVDVEQLLRIIELARLEFDIVLLDLPPAWTNWSLSVALDAQRIVMVTEQTLAHLRQAQRHLNLFKEVGIGNRKISLVVNRASKSRGRNISIQDVADTLNCEVLATIREDSGELSQAIDESKLVNEVNRRSVFAKDVSQLASLMLPRLMGREG